MTKYGKLTTGMIAAWFMFALAASASHLFQSGVNNLPLPLGLAAVTPLVIFLSWFITSAGFRQFTLNLDPHVLTWVQSWRTIGFVFLVLAAYGILPKLFALPAGWGDVLIGSTALFVGLKLATADHRKSFIAWQLLGMMDLVSAIALGALAGVIDPHGITTNPMTVLPLSLIPTFAVPLLMMFHIICIAQAVRWPVRQNARNGERLHSHSA